VGGLSAHADQADLLRWLGGFRGSPAVYLVHGETQAKEAFQARLREERGMDAAIPAPGDRLDLRTMGLTGNTGASVRGSTQGG